MDNTKNWYMPVLLFFIYLYAENYVHTRGKLCSYSGKTMFIICLFYEYITGSKFMIPRKRFRKGTKQYRKDTNKALQI